MSTSKQAGAVVVVPPRISRALRVEIAKPLNCTWDEAGRTLRDIRSVVHRLYTAAALAAIEMDSRKRRGDTTAVNADTDAYRAVERELDEIREWASKKRKGEDGQYLERLSVLKLSGGMKSAISCAAYVGFQRWKKNKGRDRVPTWKYGAPIPCRAAESELRLDGNRVVLTVKLTPVGHHEFVVIAGRGSHWERLRALASGAPELKRGDVRIKYSVSDKKWFAFIAYSEPKPLAPSSLDSGHVMIVHRGQRNLVVVSTNQGRYKVLATGDKLRAFKRRMSARRKSVQSIAIAERGNGSRGHGRQRRYDSPDTLSMKEENFVHTLCQQVGARVATLALEWGCGTVAIEEYGGIVPDDERGKRMYLDRFPNAELRGCIEWALKKRGIDLGSYDHAFMSQTCPQCDDVRETNHNLRTGMFRCGGCKFERPVDVVGAIHALRRACPDKTAGTWETRLRFERKLVDELKGNGD